MKKNFLLNKENILVLILFLFSFLINQYYAARGVSPHDSFSHFDTGYRILLGEYPFKNYWIISGPFVDYLQGLFFYLFGTNWNAYVFHSSSINSIVTLATFFILRNFNVRILYSFLFSLLFSVLAYTSSGTPFADHHATFFSLLGVYALLLGIKNENIYYWIILPIFFIFAFLSKQVPSAYIIILSILILIFYSITQNKYKWIIPSLLSSIIFTSAILFMGKAQGINLSSFYEQYITYPQTIGSDRFINYKFTFSGLILHFKYIHLALILFFYSYLSNNFSSKNFFWKKDFIYFLTIFLFSILLIFNQTLTKNQTYIFFLIPIIIGFSFIKTDLNKITSLLCIIFCIFVTLKYHVRFNEQRKFHDLNHTDFSLLKDASVIDIRLKGLKWITPEDFNTKPSEEINLIRSTKEHLKNEQRNFMLITNYSFFSGILQKKTYSPIRWVTGDGTDYPRIENRYFNIYKNLLVNSLKNNKIEVIYLIYPLQDSNIYNYINKNCFNVNRINALLVGYELKECKELL